MTYDIFSSRHDRPTFEAFYRSQESSSWNPQKFQAQVASNRYALKPAGKVTVRRNQPPIFKFPETSEQSNAWKQFKSFENEKPHAMFFNSVKQGLKDEINELGGHLVRDRRNGSMEAGNALATWQPASTETHEISCREGQRFYCLPGQKSYGLKRVPAPLRGQTLFELKEEREANLDEKKAAYNTLQNRDPRLLRTTRRQKSLQPGAYSKPYGEIGQYYDYMKGKDNEIKKLFEEKLTIGERGIKRFEQSDSQALMYMKSNTKHGTIIKELSSSVADQSPSNPFTSKKQVNFPVRKRFNQDLDETVTEVKKQINDKANGQHLRLSKGALNRTASVNGSQHSQQTRFSTMSRAQLQSYLGGGSKAGRSVITGRKSIKRNCDTNLASVKSLRAQEDGQSTNTKRLRRSAVRSAIARKASPTKAQPEKIDTIDFDADVPLAEDSGQEDQEAKETTQFEGAERSLGPTQVSNANTEALNALVAQLETEQAEKKRLSEQIMELTATTKENQKIIAEKFGLGDDKMVSQGQRYLLNSSTNVMTHPDNVFGKHLYHGL